MKEDKEPVVAEPLPLDDVPVVVTQAEAVAQLIAEDVTKAASRAVKGLIDVLLDEIDVAAAIPGADQRIRTLTKRIRNLL